MTIYSLSQLLLSKRCPKNDGKLMITGGFDFGHRQGWHKWFFGFWFFGFFLVKTKGLGLFGLLLKLPVIYYYAED